MDRVHVALQVLGRQRGSAHSALRPLTLVDAFDVALQMAVQREGRAAEAAKKIFFGLVNQLDVPRQGRLEAEHLTAGPEFDVLLISVVIPDVFLHTLLRMARLLTNLAICPHVRVGDQLGALERSQLLVETRHVPIQALLPAEGFRADIALVISPALVDEDHVVVQGRDGWKRRIAFRTQILFLVLVDHPLMKAENVGRSENP